ncbi:MAG: cupin domain-containing protein [Pseudomonadota bacterium]
MKKYAVDESFEDLESWPFDNPTSQYRILRGNPQASGRIDYGASAAQHRVGIWRCTEGAFECTEMGDELQTIIQGKLTLTRSDGESIECVAGDSIFTRKGERVVWDIQETVVKVFFTYNKDGQNR